MLLSVEVQALMEYMRATGVPHRATSAYRPGDPNRHGAKGTGGNGLAVDFAGPQRYADLVETDPEAAKAELLAVFATFEPVEGQLNELICSHADYYVKRGVRKAVRLLPPAVFKDHFDHVHSAVDLGVLILPGGVILPDDPNLPNIEGPFQFYPVINTTVGACTGYYFFSPTTGELHGHGPGAPYYGRSEDPTPG